MAKTACTCTAPIQKIITLNIKIFFEKTGSAIFTPTTCDIENTAAVINTAVIIMFAKIFFPFRNVKSDNPTKRIMVTIELILCTKSCQLKSTLIL